MRQPPNPHHRQRFPAELISHAVWLYHVFSLSFWDVELLLAEHSAMVPEVLRVLRRQAAPAPASTGRQVAFG